MNGREIGLDRGFIKIGVIKPNVNFSLLWLSFEVEQGDLPIKLEWVTDSDLNLCGQLVVVYHFSRSKWFLNVGNVIMWYRSLNEEGL